jgi:murein DD-endopeptidase MepM/ murein hydrolase activator NlpD
MSVESYVRRAVPFLALAAVISVFFADPQTGQPRSTGASAAIVDQDFPIHPTLLAASRADSILEEEATQPIRRLVTAEPGDTLSDLLIHVGVASPEAHAAILALRKVFNPRDLKAGQDVTVSFAPDSAGLGEGRFIGLSLEPDATRAVGVQREDGQEFKAAEIKKTLTRELIRAEGSIDSSLYEAATKAGLSSNVLSTMVRWLSYDVDFQREVQEGDTFSVLFERWFDETGRAVRDGEPSYIAMELSGTPILLYRHTTTDGLTEFFNHKGESVKKALLRTPADGTRLTSRFGMRRHPILGYDRMHKGIDFGLPMGAPILAAGDGVIEMAGRNGAYGNYLRIRHANGYATAYAHMSGYASGVRTGKRVSQGQVVGYVGSTGASTGPHLHYEVLVSGRQVNPLSIKMPSGRKLDGRELARFQDTRKGTEQLFVKAKAIQQLAAAK